MSAPAPRLGKRAAALAAGFCVAATAATATAAAPGAEAVRMPVPAGYVATSLEGWTDRGSALVPAGASPAWAASVVGSARIETEGRSRVACEGRLGLDPSSGAADGRLMELWGEWGPAEWASLRLGRQRIGFGSGLAWNPSNDLDPPRDPADPAAARPGIDAFQLRLDAGGASGFPLSIAVQVLPPPRIAGSSPGDAKVGAQAYAYLGEAELMLVGSLARASDPSSGWLAGAWATVPLGPIVLGLEGALRRRADAFLPGPSGAPIASSRSFWAIAGTATLREGDFALMAEAYWDEAAYGREELAAMLASPYAAAWAQALARAGSVGPLHLFARLAWSSGDLSATAGALIDPSAPAFLATAEISWAADERAVLRLRASVPGRRPAAPRDELDLSGRGLAALASASIFF